jgi:DNA-binding transcriptional LysR family regulator
MEANMNIRQLEIFTAVAERESITRAAAHLYLTQPAVSKAIRELESDVGTKLFDRLDHRLRLNAAGRSFRIQAQRLMQDWTQLANFGTTQTQALPLRVGVSLTIGQNLLPQAITRFRQMHPQTPLKLFAENVTQIKQRLLRGDIELAFIEGAARGRSFSSTLISRYELQVVAAPDFACADQISAQELLELPLLLREPGSTLRDCLDDAIRPLDLETEPVLESVNTTVLIGAAQAGLGLTILPAPLIAEQLRAHALRVIMVEGLTMQTNNYALALRAGASNVLQQDMIACFQE